MVLIEQFTNRSSAQKAESIFKKLNRAQKEKIVNESKAC